MSKPCPTFIDPLRLADQNVEFSGSYPLITLDRLAPLLHQVDGEVNFSLSFTKDSAGQRVVRGKVSARLCLICQRCLMPTWLPVEQEIFLGVVENLTMADRLPPEMDPLLVETASISVRDLVEDELILMLPVVAMHYDYCPAEKMLARYTSRKDNGDDPEILNPFALLTSIHT